MNCFHLKPDGVNGQESAFVDFSGVFVVILFRLFWVNFFDRFLAKLTRRHRRRDIIAIKGNVISTLCLKFKTCLQLSVDVVIAVILSCLFAGFVVVHTVKSLRPFS